MTPPFKRPEINLTQDEARSIYYAVWQRHLVARGTGARTLNRAAEKCDKHAHALRRYAIQSMGYREAKAGKVQEYPVRYDGNELGSFELAAYYEGCVAGDPKIKNPYREVFGPGKEVKRGK